MGLFVDYLLGKAEENGLVLPHPITRGGLLVNHRLILERVQERLKTAEAILIDNVSEYFFATARQEEWFYEEHFPCVIPPYPVFFMEAHRPTRVASEKGEMNAKLLPRRWGLLFEVVSRDFGWSDDEINSIAASAGLDLSQARWLYAVNFVYQDEDNKTFTPRQTWFFPVDGAGRITRHPKILATHALGRAAPEHRKVLNLLLMTISYPAFLALYFLQFRTVRLVDEAPPEKLNRARERRGKRPFVRYHVLEIQAAKEILSREGRVEEQGLQRALHTVRGHISFYTEERPLFGKVSGPVYKRPHVRGRSKSGIVLKDYDVKPPKE